MFCFGLNVVGQTIPVTGKIVSVKFSDNLSFVSYDVTKKMFLTNRLETLKTFETDINTFEINTSSNQFANIMLANNTIVRIEQQSEFRVDLLDLNLKDIKPYPSKINVDSYNMNLTLTRGESYFIVKKGINDQAILQTPLSNFGLETGKYWVQSDLKYVIIFVLDGGLDIYNNLTNKKENVKAGNVVIIQPFDLVLSQKQKELFIDKTTVSIKIAKPEQTRKMLNVVDEILKTTEGLIWVRIDDKIIAVK